VPRAPSPNVRRRRLGVGLRRLREAAGLTGEQVIARVGWASASKLSRLENGRSRPDLADVLDLLDLYRVTGEPREELIAITRDAGNSKSWLRAYPVMTPRQRAYAELEAGCADILEYATAIVPGLLQTPEYARLRILAGRALGARSIGPKGRDPNVDAEVAARVGRQRLLVRDVEPPRYEAVLEECALSARAGPDEVMRGQLAHLCQLAKLPNVTLRVLPAGARLADWYLPETSFSVYRFADPEDPTTVAVELLAADMQLTDEALVEGYNEAFKRLRDAARTPEASVAWLAIGAAGVPASPCAAPPLADAASSPLADAASSPVGDGASSPLADGASSLVADGAPPAAGDATARSADPPAQRQRPAQLHTEPNT
jgi:transcriptional regulator with XRE-family HTH domain